jgi:hypothetical protein
MLCMVLTVIALHVWDGFVDQLRCSFAYSESSKNQTVVNCFVLKIA